MSASENTRSPLGPSRRGKMRIRSASCLRLAAPIGSSLLKIFATAETPRWTSVRFARFIRTESKMGPDAMWPTGRPILTTQTNSSTWLVNSGWADLVILTGLGERQLPTELREPGLSIGAVSSLANALADPSSGYVIGDHKKLATALGIGVKQARRFMKTARADFVRRWCGD